MRGRTRRFNPCPASTIPVVTRSFTAYDACLGVTDGPDGLYERGSGRGEGGKGVERKDQRTVRAGGSGRRERGKELLYVHDRQRIGCFMRWHQVSSAPGATSDIAVSLSIRTGTH